MHALISLLTDFIGNGDRSVTETSLNRNLYTDVDIVVS